MPEIGDLLIIVANYLPMPSMELVYLPTRMVDFYIYLHEWLIFMVNSSGNIPFFPWMAWMVYGLLNVRIFQARINDLEKYVFFSGFH